MKLKPSLLQFIVIGMTISLLASCTRVPETSQINCNSSQAQRSYECNNSSSGGSSRIYHGGSGYRYRGGSRGSSSYSPAQVGRSGFGSFGRGASAGG
ncbi:MULTISPECIES: hypothetical protein [Nostocales]|uniref:Lipoprotein n=3 Tax=Nostocales TaxID=1161 RepID=A0A0C1R7W3_9CYAN|nr:hypothetical protein [Tolypothrix bouteillei]KAF3884771.1 hypothetical protein DA73_0400004335 [Tolypothrix bouteillei VB521301]